MEISKIMHYNMYSVLSTDIHCHLLAQLWAFVTAEHVNLILVDYTVTWAQIHEHCLTIYPKICPKIILRQKL